MILGAIILGTFTGAIASGFSLAFGHSLMYALMIYSASGSASIMMFSMLALIPQKSTQDRKTSSNSITHSTAER